MPNNLFADDSLPFVDPNKDYYEELVGEGRKYADNQAFARSRVEADLHIARLEDEQKRLREDLATRIGYETFLDQLKKTPLNTQAPQLPVEPAKEPSAITPADIERLLEQKMQQHEYSRNAQQNLNIVKAKLQEVYGPSYAQRLKLATQELQMSEQFVEGLAQSNPKALFRLLNIDAQPTKDNLFQAPPRSEFSPSSSATKGRGDSYYNDIYKKNPNLYWTPKIQNEIFERIKEIGIDAYNAT